MSLTPGVRVGPYEVVAPLGEGGMGQVWRARDLRLPREVAIKVLPEAVALDPERLARFDRESAILATLSHPNIAVIHGVEEGPFGRAIVMELVRGMGLDARLANAPLPIQEAVAIARDLADALECAHEHGIVHRDLKPANLMLGSDGRVKVLDFGLARAGPAGAGASVSSSPTSIRTTEAGTLLGTAAYMSPEQARGEPVDRRADIWAFGCVLYEALTARKAFQGRTVVDVLGAILHAEPDWTALPAGTPPSVRRLLERCLRKDPRQRLHDIGDARLVLEDIISGADLAVAAPRAAHTRGIRRLHVAWAVTTLAVSALAAFTAYGLRPAVRPAPLRKLEILVADPVLSGATRPQLTPAGDAIAYGAANRLWIRRFDQTDPSEVPGSLLAERPIWSPTGSELAFAARGRLWRVAVPAGAAVPICDLPGTGRIIAGVWRPDGTIVFSAWLGSLYSVPANGGDPVVFYEDRSVVDFHELSLLPDGRTLLLVPHTAAASLAEIAALRDGQRRTILPAQTRSQVDLPRYSRSGHLVFVRQEQGEGIWAARFDPATLEVRGTPFRIVAGSWAADVTAETLAYTSPVVPHELVWLDRQGARLSAIGPAQPLLANPAIAADGRMVAVSSSESGFTMLNLRKVRVFDVASGESEQLPASPEPSDEDYPEWSPDSRRLAFVDGRKQPFMLSWRGVGDGSLAQPLTPGNRRPSFSPDGRTLAFTTTRSGTGSDIWTIPLSPGKVGAPSALIEGPGSQLSPRFSPNGRFLAYESDESGRTEIYVRRFPLTAERWIVSRTGGSCPRWSRDGPELFYRSREGSIMAVPVTTGPTFRMGEPRRLFDESFTPGSLSRDFDVSADGQRLLTVRRASGATGRIIVVQNWLSEFER